MLQILPYDGMRTTPKKPYEGQARAKFNFVAQTNLELSLAKGKYENICKYENIYKTFRITYEAAFQTQPIFYLFLYNNKINYINYNL